MTIAIAIKESSNFRPRDVGCVPCDTEHSAVVQEEIHL